MLSQLNFKPFNRSANLAVCLLLVACSEDATPADGGDKVMVEGQVEGTSLAESPSALAVHRLANTQLSDDGERLDLYFGEDFLSFCPDIGEPFEDATTLIFNLRAAQIAPGTYPLCLGDCVGNYLDAKFDGWLLPSGDTVRPTAGSAELRSIADGRAAGSFTLEFADGMVTGDFDLEIACVDSRPQA